MPLKVVNADFSWIEQVTEPVDAVLFFESFHHCSDHLRLIQALSAAVKEDGRVFFAAEPVTADFPLPWGLRLDGESLWAIRNFGWLELGFNERYFLQVLTKFGWRVEKHVGAGTTWGTVYEACRWKRFHRAYDAASGLRTQAGTAREDGTIVADGSAGFLVFGPYARLAAGKFRVTLELTDSSSVDGHFDIACRSGSMVLAARSVSLRGPRATVALEFSLAAPESDVEVRLNCLKGASGTVRSLTIDEIVT